MSITLDETITEDVLLMKVIGHQLGGGGCIGEDPPVACSLLNAAVHTHTAPRPPLLQVDVEGWEWSVMQGAAGLLKGSHNIENVIMEYSPGGSESQGRVRLESHSNMP